MPSLKVILAFVFSFLLPVRYFPLNRLGGTGCRVPARTDLGRSEVKAVRATRGGREAVDYNIQLQRWHRANDVFSLSGEDEEYIFVGFDDSE